jgi:acyl-CoA reductase-like NAD-dependent aldehyde dehydrogenase
MKIAREEIFGLVASILPFGTFEEVIRRAKSVQYGLVGGVWTRDVAKAHRTASALNPGLVWVNTCGNFDPAVPFGARR